MLVGLSGGFYYLITMKDIINILSNVKECPPAGQGVHRWVYHVVCTFLDHRAEHQTIIDYCERRATRNLQPNEVENAIGSRLKCLKETLKYSAIPSAPSLLMEKVKTQIN